MTKIHGLPFKLIVAETLAFLFFAPAFRALPAAAAEVTGIVLNEKKNPVQDAVIYAEPIDGKKEAAGKDKEKKAPPEATMKQEGKEFVPYVLPVKVGTRVFFPNRDDVYHHVYSFSEAKTFELPLYKGDPKEPVVFDKPGAITIGCNIHDWMVGFVLVVDAPHFAVTDKNGAASLRGLPEGAYRIRVWHPDLKDYNSQPEQTVEIKNGEPLKVSFVAALKTPGLRPLRAPIVDDDSLY